MGINKSYGLIIKTLDNKVLLLQKKYSYNFETIIRGLLRK